MTSILKSGPQSLAETVVSLDHRNALVHDPPEVALDGTVKYTLGGSIFVPEEPGVYLIHDLRGVLYVGRTGNLYQRYFQHYWDSHNSRVTAALRRPLGRLEFSWMTVDGCDQASLERELIRALQPLCNRLLYKAN
jgi:predicted GIY-YIG superfamily endonuclease